MKRNFVKSAGSVKRPKVLFVDGVKPNWKVKSRLRIKIPSLAMVRVLRILILWRVVSMDVIVKAGTFDEMNLMPQGDWHLMESDGVWYWKLGEDREDEITVD